MIRALPLEDYDRVRQLIDEEEQKNGSKMKNSKRILNAGKNR